MSPCNHMPAMNDVEFEDSTGNSQLALTLGGGGARAAYQVGVLRGIASRHPNLKIPLLTGVSAGAINIAGLSNSTGSFRHRVDELTELWQQLRLENVFQTGGASLVWRAVKVGMRLTVGLPDFFEPVHGMVDTRPLHDYLSEAFSTPDSILHGVRRNLDDGTLRGVAVTTNAYSTGDTVTFFMGRAIAEWERPHRHSVETSLSIDHIMASSALPLFFSPVQIDGQWYGDGGVRLVSPLAPAVHLGADRLLVISTHFAGNEQPRPETTEAPSPATVLAAMYNAVFLDQLDQDELQIRRTNRLLSRLPPDSRDELREIGLFVMRPSQDLGSLAFDLKGSLPPTFRFLLSQFSGNQPGSDDFLSTLMFNPDYVQQLIELGEHDAATHAEELAAFLE
jgi:NTE family protein